MTWSRWNRIWTIGTLSQNVGGAWRRAGPLLAGVLVHALGRQEAKTDGTDGLYRRCSVVGDDEANPGIGSAPDAAPVIQEAGGPGVVGVQFAGDALRVVMPMGPAELRSA